MRALYTYLLKESTYGRRRFKETATGDPEYDPEGNNICGNEETGEERT